MSELFAAVLLTLLVSGGAQAAVVEPVYRLAGTWLVGGTSSNGKSAPNANTNPQVYSGLEAASTIFGGRPDDYAISTTSMVIDSAQTPYIFKAGDLVYILSDGTYTINGVLQQGTSGPLHYLVNMEAFLDGWGDTQYLTTPNSQFFKKDVDPEGYNFPQAQRDAYSAWVADHTQQGGLDARNYAFVPVPEPHAWTLMLGGGILLVLFRTARKSSSRV